MTKSISFQKIGFTLLTAGLLMSTVLLLPVQAAFSAVGTNTLLNNLFTSSVPVPPYSIYTIDYSSNLLGIKVGNFSFYLDDNESYSSASNAQKGKVQSNGSHTNNPIANPLPSITKNTSSPAEALSASANTVSTTDLPTVSILEPTSEPSATPTSNSNQPTESSQNLILNFSFEEAENGLATKWTHSNAGGVSLDTNSQGNDGSNSLHILTKSFATIFIFSDKITIDPEVTYKWQQYVKTPGPSFLSFYIDEYDVNGTWISGQWKGQLTTAFDGIISWTYIPTNNNVKSINVQYSTHGDVPNDIYLDSVIFSK